MASNGSLSSRSYSALRGWNQPRSLFTARSARNWIASGEKPRNVVGGSATAGMAGSSRASNGVYSGCPESPWSAKVAAAPERLDHERPDRLVDGEAEATGRAEGDRRS